jgi:hypothetical protein
LFESITEDQWLFELDTKQDVAGVALAEGQQGFLPTRQQVP